MDRYSQSVEKHRQLIMDALEYIWKNPELGYREWKTHAYLEEGFAKLGYELTLAGDIPGFYAEADTGRPGPTVAVFGELDGLVCSNHPDADPETGAVHACGHCCQTASLLGLAAALKEPGVLDGLSGKIRLVAVPAEETVEQNFLQQLRQKGIVRYASGKQEFMYRGLMDGVDMAMMFHASTQRPPNHGALVGGSNGMIGKQAIFTGVSAHAGGAPHRGVNALYAANLGLSAINNLRETFPDDAHIRVHPIITKGGDAVNAIPDCVTIGAGLRGASMEVLTQTNKKINRALAASAAAMGAKVQIRDLSWHWTRNFRGQFSEIALEAMQQELENAVYEPWKWLGSCSDIADVGAVMPTVYPVIGGTSGKGHGSDFRIADPDSACIKSTKVLLRIIGKLLENDAQKAKAVIEEYEPAFGSAKELFAYMDKMTMDCDGVSYEDDGSITLNLE